MSRTGSDKDPMLRVAIPLVLGVVVGFALVMLGIVLLFLAILATTTDENNVSGWVWLIMGLAAEAVGIFLMWWILRSTPEPGTFGPNSSN